MHGVGAMFGKRHTAALVAFLCFSIGGAHCADLSTDYPLSYKDGPGGYWVVTLGGYGAAEPAFPGSKKYDFAFVPVVDIYRAGEREWLTLPLDAISITLYQAGNFRAGVAGDYIFDRNHNDDSAARGLRDINYTLQAGGFAEYYPAPFLRTRVEVLQGFTGTDSLVANLSADFIFRPSCCWLFTAGPRLQFANTQYESTFFSVNAVESARTFLPTFHASGGLNSAGVDATARYNVTEHFSVRAFADWERLVGDGADSPIVKFRGSQDQFEVGIGVAYKFNYRP
jgi:MipA family protein